MGELQIESSEREYCIKGAKLNMLTLACVLPLFAVSVLFFMLLNGWHNTFLKIVDFVTLKVFLLLFLGIVIHEAIHAITWMVLLPTNLKNIKFGFNIKSLSPYVHCTIPMFVWQYRLSGLLPGLLMGVLPVILSFFINSTELNFIGFLFLWAASSDFISLFLLRKFKSTTRVLDHPDEMGFIIVN